MCFLEEPQVTLTIGSITNAARVSQELFNGPLEQQLNQADAKLGDGDTGITLRRFFDHVWQVAQRPQQDLGQWFATCGRAGAQATGSSLGTLCAIGLIQAGHYCAGKTELPWSEVGTLIHECESAMAKRAHAELGDKTVLDTLYAVGVAVCKLDEPKQIAQAAVRASRHTLEEFRPKRCKAGRARMFGQQSEGVDDPGMLALASIIERLARPVAQSRADRTGTTAKI
jgi:hypothetical protein